jgi:hypothetical protein
VYYGKSDLRLRGKHYSTPELTCTIWPDAAVIRVYDAAGNVIETHEQTGDFKEW